MDIENKIYNINLNTKVSNKRKENSINEEENELTLLKNMSLLPEELVNMIYEYIPQRVKIFLTKNMYLYNHHLIRNYISRYKIEEYFRVIVRKDYDFVFRIILYENYWRWIELKQYYHKGIIFASYLYFIRTYCYDSESTKCINVINTFFLEQGLQKNLHKKKTIQYIKWKA